MEKKQYEGRRLEITNIRRGRDGREGILYADLIDADTGELLINATLCHIHDAIHKHL